MWATPAHDPVLQDASPPPPGHSTHHFKEELQALAAHAKLRDTGSLTADFKAIAADAQSDEQVRQSTRQAHALSAHCAGADRRGRWLTFAHTCSSSWRTSKWLPAT